MYGLQSKQIYKTARVHVTQMSEDMTVFLKASAVIDKPPTDRVFD